MSKGVIYILTNPSFPQYVKIGYASDLQRRLRELLSLNGRVYVLRHRRQYHNYFEIT